MSVMCRRNFLGAGSSLLVSFFRAGRRARRRRAGIDDPYAGYGQRQAGRRGADRLRGAQGRGLPIDPDRSTNAEPLLTPETMKTGQFQLTFYIAEYFTKLCTVLPNPPFLDRAVIQFGMADATSHYHVPLLASPWSYQPTAAVDRRCVGSSATRCWVGSPA